MKALFLIGGPGSGKNVIMEEVLKGYSFKEYDSKQIRQSKKLNENLIVITGNAYDVDSIAYDKLFVESYGYETFLIYVDVSKKVCNDRTPFLSEEVRNKRYDNSKNNINILNDIFEGNITIFNNDINKDHIGVISKQIRLEQIENTLKSIINFLKEEKQIDQPRITNRFYENLVESCTKNLKSKLKEYAPGTQLTKTELNPEKQGVLYDEDADKVYGKVVLTRSKQKDKSNFEKDKEDKLPKSSTPSTLTPNTGSSSGIGDQFDTRGSGTVYPMSGLGSVTYRESVSFSKFRKKLKESIDSPSFDMAVTGGEYGPSNKEDLIDYGAKYSGSDGPNKKKIKKEEKESDLKDACWKGYTAIGLKKKNGKIVPNCVPESVNESIERLILNNIPLSDNDFRMCSEAYFGVFNVIRENLDLVEMFNLEDDIDLLESDIGTFAWFDEESKYVPLDVPFLENSIFEGEEEKQPLNKPKRGGSKKFYVYVKTPEGNVKKVSFGDTTGLSVKFNDPERRKSFVARHNCASKNDKTTPGYWSCRLPRYAKSLGLSGGGSGFW